MRRTHLWAAPLILVLLTVQFGFCWKALNRSLSGDVDFRAFYASGRLVASGRAAQIYSYEEQKQVQNEAVSRSNRTLPFLYPAYAALPFVPLSFLPCKTAFITFGIVNLALLWLTGSLIRPHISLLREYPSWLPAILCLCFFPVSIALMQGQISFMLLLLYTLCFLCLKKGFPFAAGLLLAITLMKFQIALPIALLLLLWREYRAVQGFAAGAILLVILSIAITGVHGAIEYPASLARMTTESLANPWSARQRYGMFPADMPNLHGVFFFLTKGRWTGQALTLIVSAAVIAWAARQRHASGIALPAAMLVSYHLQVYDLTLLLLPLALATSHAQQSPARPKRAGTLGIGALILIVPIAPFLLVQSLCCLFAFPVLAILWANRPTQDRPGESAGTDAGKTYPSSLFQTVGTPAVAART